VTFGRVASALLVAGVLNLASMTALANRVALDSGSMNDGAAGNWYDSDNSFFGFGSQVTGPFWGANLLFTDGATLIDGITATSTSVTVTGITLLFKATGAFSPLVAGVPNTAGADVATACSLVGTPQFGPSVQTSITCQFADPNFVTNFEALAADDTRWYPLINLGGSGSIGHASTAPGAVQLTFLSSAPGVPEPGTAGLCLLGIATAIGVFRSKQKKGQA
jgi:PEP-CTERM motif